VVKRNLHKTVSQKCRICIIKKGANAFAFTLYFGMAAPFLNLLKHFDLFLAYILSIALHLSLLLLYVFSFTFSSILY